MATIGYTRSSELESHGDLPDCGFAAAGASTIYADSAASMSSIRPALDECMTVLSAGDVLVVRNTEDFGGSTTDLVSIVGELRRRSINFKSLSEPFDTTTPDGEMFFHACAQAAQKRGAAAAARPVRHIESDLSPRVPEVPSIFFHDLAREAREARDAREAREAPINGRRKANADIDHPFELLPVDHFVFFYENEAELEREVAGYLASGLDAGNSGIVIATPEHRQALSNRLGVQERDRQSVLFLDARETLNSLMLNGVPDATLFEANVGAIVRESLAGSTGLTAYGEMVALLWSDGNVLGALDLEELWNTLQTHAGFSLLCAYPADNAHEASWGVPAICSSHSAVFGG